MTDFEFLALLGTHVLDEAERSLHDALCVLSQTVKDSRVVYGGGWPEMQMAVVVQKQAARTPGKRSLAMEAFAHALRAIPSTICDNAGASQYLRYQSSEDGKGDLRARHSYLEGSQSDCMSSKR